MTRVSVVIPTIGRRHLVSAVESVLWQIEAGDECIVVVDGPRSLPPLPTNQWLHLCRLTAPSGPGAARNEGARRAVGDHVMFLDDDDELAPDGLPILRKHAAPGIGVVGWDASLNADGSTAVRKRNDLPVDGVGAIGSRAIPSVGTTLVPRESFVPFDGQLPASEDVEWWMRQVQHMQILTRPQVVLLVRQHGGERRSADLRAKLAARQLILERHAGYLSTHPLVAHYQYRRAAGFAFATNDMELASRYYFEAFRRRPTLRLLARTLQTAARSKLAA